MDYKRVPAYNFTQIANMKREDVLSLYDMMEEDGHADSVFYDGGVNNRNDWLDFVVYNRCWTVRCDHPEDGPVGVWWLNGFFGKSAMVHFSFFGKGLQRKIELGRQSMRWLAGLDVLKSVFGITPKAYRSVWPFIDAVGFKRVGELPGACMMARHSNGTMKYIDGVASILDLSLYKDNALQKESN